MTERQKGEMSALLIPNNPLRQTGLRVERAAAVDAPAFFHQAGLLLSMRMRQHAEQANAAMARS